ncbi:hypothetical protein CABS01_15331 [Colletotrichum abscissum]|uniref:uncharacterized protein n=1 Tax=Colletotrichum abscissum TaxID=1671311 RepID=UPI0027D5B808|nr:uncharacterized protein CABS01_15331 [Colletotrichum abscissum]KAK1476567.1 hypothetical protein CABS01_15331 [Colletotrichum abscissum]
MASWSFTDAACSLEAVRFFSRQPDRQTAGISVVSTPHRNPSPRWNETARCASLDLFVEGIVSRVLKTVRQMADSAEDRYTKQEFPAWCRSRGNFQQFSNYQALNKGDCAITNTSSSLIINLQSNADWAHKEERQLPNDVGAVSRVCSEPQFMLHAWDQISPQATLGLSET